MDVEMNISDAAGPSGSGLESPQRLGLIPRSREGHRDTDDNESDDESSRKPDQMDDFDSTLLEDENTQMKEIVFDYLRMKFTGHRNAR